MAAQAVVDALSPVRQLGSGSNGAVVECHLLVPVEGFDVPVGKPLAVKAVSHFWNEQALASIVDCELLAVETLPPSPAVVHVFATFRATIPHTLVPFLTADMQEALAGGPMSTQFFIMELCGDTLYRHRMLRMPLPVPFATLLHFARRVVEGLLLLHNHRMVHLDLTLSNVLVDTDGHSPLLSDFGICRVWPDGDTDMVVQYQEPFPVLLHPFALAPEVLSSYDTAVAAHAAEGTCLPVPFAGQGAWSAGVVLCDLASGVHPLPLWPLGDKVTDKHYDVAAVMPALPDCPQFFVDVVRGLLVADAGVRLGLASAHEALLGMELPAVPPSPPGHQLHIQAHVAHHSKQLAGAHTVSALAGLSSVAGFVATEPGAELSTADIAAIVQACVSATVSVAAAVHVANTLRNLSCLGGEEAAVSLLEAGVAPCLMACVEASPADAAVVEHACMAVGNLLRFSASAGTALEASWGVDVARWAVTVRGGLLAHAAVDAAVEGALHALQHLQTLDPAVVASSGVVDGLVAVLDGPSTTHVDETLRIACVTVQTGAETVKCDLAKLAAAISTALSNPDRSADAFYVRTVMALVRNATCVASVPGSSTAFELANGGCTVAVEAAMEAHAGDAEVVDHGRCALYNMLVRMAGDVCAVGGATVFEAPPKASTPVPPSPPPLPPPPPPATALSACTGVGSVGVDAVPPPRSSAWVLWGVAGGVVLLAGVKAAKRFLL